MNKELDVTNLVNEIIEVIDPIFSKCEDGGVDAVRNFVVAFFGALCKLCFELEMTSENAFEVFAHMWEVMSNDDDDDDDDDDSEPDFRLN